MKTITVVKCDSCGEQNLLSINFFSKHTHEDGRTLTRVLQSVTQLWRISANLGSEVIFLTSSGGIKGGEVWLKLGVN